MDGTGVMWSGYTAVLGFLVVFRNNQAYSRFWEGATLVNQTRGEWFNAVSSLMAFCTNDPERKREVHHFEQLMLRLASLLHCSALQEVCEIEDANLEIIDCQGVEQESLLFLEQVHDRCEIIMSWIQRLIMKAHLSGVVVAPPPILSRSFQELSRGVVNLNNVRKIRDIPFPFPYNQVLIFMLAVHWVVTAIQAATVIDSIMWAGIICFCVTGALWSVIYIGKEIDQPFGEDANDLPMVEMQKDFNRSLMNLMHPRAKAIPTFEIVERSRKVTVTKRYEIGVPDNDTGGGRKNVVQGRRTVRFDGGISAVNEEQEDEDWAQRQCTPLSDDSNASLQPVPKLDSSGRRNMNRLSGYVRQPIDLTKMVDEPTIDEKQEASAATILCPHCQGDMNPSWRYCMTCGQSGASCVSCQARLPPSATFCPECGCGVGSAEEVIDHESDPSVPSASCHGLQEQLEVTDVLQDKVSIAFHKDREFVHGKDISHDPNIQTLLQAFDSARGGAQGVLQAFDSPRGGAPTQQKEEARQVAEFVI
eukprot:TRINITY_DN6806_c0_g2_i1.p1 TRINITY_DN6806_c0_g2~~TRINITY_DN6806_c0_g2_i1.p1  ORF type:complete len:614 (-),score=83.83 TRINITY_DN6806_c0_g2_i1:76-1671(-)